MREALLRHLGTKGFAAAGIEPLAGDLSQRRYFRVRLADGDSLLAAHYPAEIRAVAERFVRARDLLAGAGVTVPAILDASFDAGWMLLEDLGPRTVFDLARDGEDATRFLPYAIEAGRRIAALEPAAVAALGSPPLDEALLARELGVTFEHLFAARGLAGEGLAGERFREALLKLCARLAAEPVRPCHRDFMVRNLLPLADGGVAVIDFQDLRMGPLAYDLASLLNDSLFLGEARESDELARALPSGSSREGYARAVVQRALKAAGTFARSAAAGKPHHLPLIAPTLARAAAHLARLPETAEPFAEVGRWWRERLAEKRFC
jgi:aminoglycoside/choline kinase family phosphotransferase